MSARRVDLALVAASLVALVWFASGASGFSPLANTLHVLLLGAAAWNAWRAAELLGAGNPARPAWLWLVAWLAAFGLAEAIDAWYEVLWRAARPFPSLADALFIDGYLCLVAALLVFIHAYRSSGYAVGSTAQHAALLGAGLLASLGLGYRPLAAIAGGAAPLNERVVSLLYPTLDFVVLSLTLVLLRITLAFRGGHVFRVWALLLLGLFFTCAADMLFAFLPQAGPDAPRAPMEALYLLSYLALLLGTRKERALVG